MRQILRIPLLTGVFVTACWQSGADAVELPRLSDWTAEELVVETVLDSPEQSTLSLHELAGKTIVVEFWASWCTPCVEALPDWNRIVEDLAAQDVVFLTLTDENSPAKLRSFLAHHPVRGLVGIDRDRSLFDAFDVHRIPSTTVITPGGAVHRCLAGLPNTLQLEAVLRGDSVTFQADDSVTQSKTRRAEPAAKLYSVKIQPSEEPRVQRTSHASGKYHATAHTLWQVATFAFEQEGRWVTLAGDLPPERYDVDAECAGGLPCVRSALQNALAHSFGIIGTPEDMEHDVWILNAPSGGSLGSSLRQADPDNPPKAESKTDFLVLDTTLDHLAALLQRWLGHPVVNETGLEGSFDAVLRWRFGDSESLRAAVDEQWGLALTQDRRVIPVTVVHLENPGTSALSNSDSRLQKSKGVL